MISLKTPEEIAIMGEGGKILSGIMTKLIAEVRPGIPTRELDRIAESLISSAGAKPSFKGYQGFPGVLCTSINDELVHVAPSERILKEGDIISLDSGLIWKGYHVDMAATVAVGRISPEARRLIWVTKKALKRGVKKARVGNTVGDIGNTIQRYVESQGYNVSRDLCGHGIGRELHEDPQIPNYGKRRSGEKLCEGMVICIEPMVMIGDWKLKKCDGGFGFKTADGSLSAHFEYTVAITKEGAKILSRFR